MTDKQRKTLRLVYSIVLSVLTIVAGVLLIVQAERIYHSPDSYSREIVSEYLGNISAVLYIWIALVVGGGILWAVFPPEQKKLRGTIYYTDRLEKLKRRLPVGVESEKLRKATLIKRIVWGVAIAFAVVAFVMIGLVVWNADNYHPTTPMQDMLAMLPDFLPWVAVAFFLAICATVYTEISAKHEVEEVKRLIVEHKNEEIGDKKPSLKEQLIARIPDKLKTAKFRRYALLGVRISLAILSVVLIIVGVINGGFTSVLEKAAAICRECIGLG